MVAEQTVSGDLQDLRDELIALGGIVEATLLHSVDLLKRCDLDGLERVGDDEQRICERRLAIEMGCMHLIVTQWPKDHALRTAVALVEIALELERIGGYAKRVARANSLTLDHHLRKPLVSIHHLATEVQAMLDKALASFVRCDVAEARSVFCDAERLDALYRKVYQELVVVMGTSPRLATQAIYLSRAAYNLKRAGERVTAIAEWVVFAVVGTMGDAHPVHREQTPPSEITGQPAVTI
jgi:phosphate transport system protein